ncbi:PD-(D/E)XK motif protein [Turicibacter bilis]|uniref:PD-(D/E)XK motif protein n=1 Tax=Turicibacter bilis TaxID=2735723 RepID=UPI0031BAF3D5
MKIEKVYKDGVTSSMELDCKAHELQIVKDDVKIKVESCREIIHNAIDEQASQIDIDICYENNTNVVLTVSYSGDKLNSFENIDEIINAILELNTSYKRSRSDMIGGMGRGLKLILSSEKLEITSINKGKEFKITIENPDKQIEQISNNEHQAFIINVEKEGEELHQENKVTFKIHNLSTGDISNWQHDSLVKYLKYYSVIGKIGDNTLVNNNLIINVQGLLKEKHDGKVTYRRKPQSEKINIDENVFDSIKKFGEDNDCSFNYIKGHNGTLESNVRIEDRLKEEEIKQLQEFSKETKFYIFRTTDKTLKRFIMRDTQEIFGIYPACRGVMINEKFTALKKTTITGDKTGGNLYQQYFGYFYNDIKFLPSGNRNYARGNDTYIKFIDELNEKIIGLINKVLAFTDSTCRNKTQKVKSNTEKKEKITFNKVEEIVIQGLFGELYHIYCYPRLIKHWVACERLGARRSPHDFEYNQKFDEIKTTITESNIIRISSVYQLDDARKGNLHIYYLKNHIGNAGTGDNIIDLIKKVVEKLEAYGKLWGDYEEKFFSAIADRLKFNNGYDFKEKYKSITNNPEKYDLSSLDRYTVLRRETYKIGKDYKFEFNSLQEMGIEFDKGFNLNLSKLQAKGNEPVIDEFK